MGPVPWLVGGVERVACRRTWVSGHRETHMAIVAVAGSFGVVVMKEDYNWLMTLDFSLSRKAERERLGVVGGVERCSSSEGASVAGPSTSGDSWRGRARSFMSRAGRAMGDARLCLPASGRDPWRTLNK